jgi:hypothetical protein
MCPPGFNGHVTRRQRLEIACFGSERETNFAGDGMSAGSVFDTAASGAKRIASGVSFEVYA